MAKLLPLQAAAALFVLLCATESISVAANPIVTENQLPGSNQWQLFGLAANDTVKQIKGYASATSVDAGESITFYVTVAPAQTFTIDIYRIGYYQGLGGRLMQRIGPTSGTQQPSCPRDPTTGMNECHWAPSSTITIPATWTTGVYLALLTNANNYQNYITFVVRDDSRRADFLYQQSVTTYQAYNNYPDDGTTGKSLYDFNSFGANTVTGSTRAAKVSFDRPYTDLGDGQFLSYEVYFVQWMEQQGYDVGYSTNIDTHSSGGRLLNRKAFLSVGHDEYWSKPMRDAVEAARNSGVNLGFFGANNAYWQIRFESSSTGVANRVQVCYKLQSVDPVQGPTTTVLWRDPVINLPEQSLIGIMYTAQNKVSFVDDPDPYIVTNSSHFIYAGTGLQNGNSVPKAVGYETDRYVSEFPLPNAVAGTYTLLSHSPVVDVNTHVADYANSSIYQAPSGAWVFATGSINWAWVLSNPGYMDARLTQLTKNVLNLFVNVTVPSPPSSLVATPVSSSQIHLNWTVSPPSDSSFVVERALSSAFSAFATFTIPPGQIAWSDTGLASGTTYFYRVRAVNTAGSSAYSNTASTSTLLGSLTVNPASLINAALGIAYSATLTASGGSGPFSWSIISGALPPGLNLAASTGVISGTPLSVGLFSFTAGVTNASQAGSRAYSLNVGGGAGSGITRVQFKHTYPGSTAAFTSNNTAGNTIIVVASWSGTVTPTISDTRGNTYAALPRISGGGTGSNVAQLIFYATNIAAGANTVTLSGVTAANDIGLTALEYSGIVVSGPLGMSWTTNGSTSGATTTPTSTAFTPGSPNSLILAAFADETIAQGSISASSGFALIQGDGGHVDAFSEKIGPATVSQSTGFSLSSATNSWLISVTEFRAAPSGPPPAPTGVQATGGNVQVSLTWTASAGATAYNVKRSTASGGPYTTVGSPAVSGFTNTGLTNGTPYFYVVTAANGLGESGNSAEATATPGAVPVAPTGVQATGGNAQVSLTWTASASATAYNVKRATVSGGPYTTVGSPASASFTNTGLTNGTSYFYVVTATNALGESGNSAQASATPGAIPSAPTGVQATGGNTQVSLTWTASAGATGYNVKRATVSGGPYTTVGSPATANFTNTGLTNGTPYFYVVTATNGLGESANSAQASATPGAVPAAPVGLQATAGNSQVSLTWTPSAGATAYNVKRATVSGGPYTTVSSPTAATFTNTGLTNGTAYFYVVTATNALGESGSSPQVSATPGAVPSAPIGLQATAGNTQITLTWTPSAGATGYNVKRATVSGGPYTTVGSPTATTFTNTGLTNGTPYFYVVTATNALGESGNSSQVSGTPGAIPSAPIGLQAVGGNALVSLSWTASASATGYNVKRATVSGGPYTTVGSPATANFTNTGLTNGTSYFYVVTATNAMGESGNSTQVSAIPGGAPAQPTGLQATAGNSQVALTWTASAGATGYNVKRATVNGGPYSIVGSATATNFTNTGLTNGTPYFYVVTATNGVGESANSTQVSATPVAAATTITRVQTKHVYPGGYLPFTANNTAGNTIIVSASWHGTGTPTISDTRGNTYVALTKFSGGGTGSSVSQIFYIASNIAAGANTITVSGLAATDDLGVNATEYSGISKTNALGITSTKSGAGVAATMAPVSNAFTPGTAGSLIVAAFADETVGQSLMAAGPGYTLVQGDGTHVDGIEEKFNAATVSQTAAFTLSSATNTWIMYVAEFRPGP